MSAIERIRQRRAELIARAAQQRDDIAAALGTLRAPLAVADKGIAAVTYVKSHPGIAAAAIVATAVISPRRTLRWAQRAILIWRGIRWVQSSTRAAAARLGKTDRTA
jgi:hypothetical protein